MKGPCDLCVSLEKSIYIEPCVSCDSENSNFISIYTVEKQITDLQSKLNQSIALNEELVEISFRGCGGCEKDLSYCTGYRNNESCDEYKILEVYQQYKDRIKEFK